VQAWILAVIPERATPYEMLDGNEILPIEYSDNCVTIYPGETVEIYGTVWKDANPCWVRNEGYNTPAFSINIK
jgi:exo-1,4-beta-D-glucosaminidase